MTRHSIAHLTVTDTGAELGPLGERIAVAHLTGDDGLDLVATNWAVRTGAVRGELDAVALDHDRGQVVVVEVKTRRDDARGGPLAAVTASKQRRIRSLTTSMLVDARLPYRRVRFDVVAVWLPHDRPGRLEHLEGAF